MPKRALISVSDKTGLVDFARGLSELGFEIISTGGTQAALQEADVPVTAVETLTQYPECFGGRVKTMHPAICGGILMRRSNKNDLKEAAENEIEPIDLVVVNLYPFAKVAAQADATAAEVVEQIDIGGPTLLRSAAKNAADVTVICDLADYERVLNQLKAGNTTPELRAELAAKVFAHTAAYDALIAKTLSAEFYRGRLLENQLTLRYGENPHQTGKYYDIYGQPRPWHVVQAEKPISYLNLLDADGAWQLIAEFKEPAAACIKHANPSGVAVGNNIAEAFQRSYDADRLSAFGVIVALNQECSAAVLEKIIDQKIFVEVIVAPSYSSEALALLKKRPKLRAITVDPTQASDRLAYRTCLGGMLIQELDTRVLTEADLTCVTSVKPTAEQVTDLLFAWKVVKHAKSNAIVFAKQAATTGIGCGQTSRVDSTIIAARRAGDLAAGSVMASDAFFPFADSIEEAAKHGITAIIQPGGSIRDEEVIAKADELGIAMVFTGIRAFRH